MFLFDHKIWRGDSGRLYRFKITLTRKGIPDYGGVYIFVRRRFVFFLKAIYVGKATNFRERLYGHEKFAKAVYDYGVTERHVYNIATDYDRAAVEEDLIRALKPKMNDVMLPRSETDGAVYKPVPFGWAILNWIKVNAQRERPDPRRHRRNHVHAR
ncbi:MAG TPA: GIY-YIG nuclease family protein [Caulobacterales bacterium]|nr:GIY-YIG nuclease family protein [Caulobacterales bacterium]